MSDWHNERSDIPYYIEQAHEARAEAMARAGYLAVAAVSAIMRAAGVALPRAVRSALRAVAAGSARRAALREILVLDDRMLRDIGLTRADARAAVDGTLRERVRDVSSAEPAGYRDIALTSNALGGCNDNDERRRAA